MSQASLDPLTARTTRHVPTRWHVKRRLRASFPTRGLSCARDAFVLARPTANMNAPHLSRQQLIGKSEGFRRDKKKTVDEK